MNFLVLSEIPRRSKKYKNWSAETPRKLLMKKKKICNFKISCPWNDTNSTTKDYVKDGTLAALHGRTPIFIL